MCAPSFNMRFGNRTRIQPVQEHEYVIVPGNAYAFGKDLTEPSRFPTFPKPKEFMYNLKKTMGKTLKSRRAYPQPITTTDEAVQTSPEEAAPPEVAPTPEVLGVKEEVVSPVKEVVSPVKEEVIPVKEEVIPVKEEMVKSRGSSIDTVKSEPAISISSGSPMDIDSPVSIVDPPFQQPFVVAPANVIIEDEKPRSIYMKTDKNRVTIDPSIAEQRQSEQQLLTDALKERRISMGEDDMGVGEYDELDSVLGKRWREQELMTEQKRRRVQTQTQKPKRMTADREIATQAVLDEKLRPRAPVPVQPTAPTISKPETKALPPSIKASILAGAKLKPVPKKAAKTKAQEPILEELKQVLAKRTETPRLGPRQTSGIDPANIVETSRRSQQAAPSNSENRLGPRQTAGIDPANIVETSRRSQRAAPSNSQNRLGPRQMKGIDSANIVEGKRTKKR